MEVRKFGKYEVIEKIGQGGMGEVFRARDPLLKRDVAIKTITPSASADDDVRQRFEREAQLAAGLNHPNIVHIYDFGEEGGKIYMAMELLLGMDLKAAMKLGTLEGMDRKLALMEDVCEGLAFAHYREIVHRDLKPANIHIQPDGRAKIMDFGLAKLESSDMTRTGVIMGTPDYMSPEQVQGSRADFRSDVYSLGAVFYELLAGRRPFQAESTHALLFQVLYNNPDPIESLVPGLPPSVRQIVECAMSKDPAQRFQNGGEMRDAVRAARAGLQAGDADATLVADVTLSPNPATPSGGFTPPGRAATPHPSSGGIYPRRPVSGAPQGGVPISGGISGYPHPLTPAGGPGSMGSAGPGMTPGSQGYGSFSQPAVVVQRSSTGLVVGLAIAVIAVGAVALYAMGLLPGVPRESSSASQEVSQLQHDLLQRDLDSADEKLRAKDYEGSLAVVERILSRDPGNAQATRMRGDIQTVLKDLEAKTVEARAALDGGDPDRAAEIVSGMLQVNPGYAPALELSGKLDDQLRTRAEGLRAGMVSARRSAEQTRGATALGSFVQAASVAGEAQALLDSGSFNEAAGKFKAATDGFNAARQQAEQAMNAPKPARTGTSKPPPAPPPPDPTMARKA
ncbi:MAG TPA: protein kinase, partial [Candidatus Saccharimonadales bacterium]|nr:protein kinase [Candidatus Saccharimonadales bacterium]